MAKTQFYKLSIDKLVVCLSISEKTLPLVARWKQALCVEHEGSLFLSGDKYIAFNKQKSTKKRICFDFCQSINSQFITVGFFTFFQESFDKCLFEFNNEALYTPYLKTKDEEVHNCIYSLYEFTKLTGLQFNNITTCEIALDTNVNVIKRINKIEKNGDYSKCILGKLNNADRVSDFLPRGIENYKSNSKMADVATRYINLEKKRKNGKLKKHITFKIYNKLEDLKNKDKYKAPYILKWLGFTEMPSQLYRAEVRFCNEIFRAFCTNVFGEKEGNIVHNNALLYLCNESFLASNFAYVLYRVYRFRNKKTKALLTLPELLGIEGFNHKNGDNGNLKLEAPIQETQIPEILPALQVSASQVLYYKAVTATKVFKKRPDLIKRSLRQSKMNKGEKLLEYEDTSYSYENFSRLDFYDYDNTADNIENVVSNGLKTRVYKPTYVLNDILASVITKMYNSKKRINS